ncbi:MAG: cadherin-like domain-containing protein [Colwellia sp.]|nr:cadherin-like domain-containing protein [Colwellia sp.]
MKKSPLIISLLSALIINQASATNELVAFNASQWKEISTANKQQVAQHYAELNSRAVNDKKFELNVDLLTQVLGNEKELVLDLPLPNGQFATFRLSASSVMNRALAEKYPSIKTFTGYQVDKPENYGHFDMTPHGFHGVFTFENDKVFIDPIMRNNRATYHSYFRKDAQPLSLNALGKRLPPRQHFLATNRNKNTPLRTNKKQATNLITYRIAVATTAEYSEFHGGTKELSLASVVTMLNRVNEVYQRDLAITLELVANNDSIIFLDAASDPFKNTDEDIDVITDVINSAISVDAYDIGHIVGTGGGGLAGLGVVCSEQKAEGLTGSDSPTSDSFHIDYVAHEIGHQFGAEHTFNGALGGCEGNREASSAYEPGSASTIMGYAGICAEQNLQNNSDAYFHLHSIEQISAFTASGTGNTCGVKSARNNNIPSVNAGNNYSIPARTPFTLTGQASDSDGDSLSYSWEQYDLGTISSTKEEDNTDDGKRPLFRVFAPNNINSRTFPQLKDILAAQQSYGETLPTTTRELNFRLVVRDHKSNVVNDAMTVSVIGNEQGFSITEPNAGVSWQGEQQTVTWHIADTDKHPVSCASVNISLSTDSGNNFNQVLVSETPNDGSQLVNLPDVNTETARVKVACSNNIFFAINTGNIKINSAGTSVTTKPVFVSQEVLVINEDEGFTLNKTKLTFSQNQNVDSITLLAGENYQVENLTLTPALNFTGELLLKLTASKGQLTSDEFTVKVTVTAINDAPVIIDDSASVIEDSSNNSLDVIVNDTDVDNESLTIKSVSYAGKGRVVIENNKISYSPAKGFTGIEKVTYLISDGQLDSQIGTLTVTVSAKVKNDSGKSSGGAGIYLLILVLMATARLKRVKK